MPPVVLLSRDLPAADAVVLPGGRDGVLDSAAEADARALGIDAATALKAQRATGKAGEVTVVPAPGGDRRVVLAGVGEGSLRDLRSAAAAAARAATKASTLAMWLPAGAPVESAQAVAEAAALASYRPPRSGAEERSGLATVTVVSDSAPAGTEQPLDNATAVVAAVFLARDLANTPSLVKTPDWMVEQARAAARTSKLSVEVWDEERLRAEGFGGILAVGRGSARPPRLLQLTYQPPKTTEHVVLVGKGITFDSGGLSLKPLDGMKAMKTDMAGGAAVIATMTALQQLGVRRRVTALVPLAENLVGDAATRPGDVLRHYGGRTTEVLNTDAEGRLVLADALAYAVAHLQPDVIVDLATLTGAATLGLGRQHGAMFATSDPLAEQLTIAALDGGEALWRMPLVEEYRDTLDSSVADIRNVGDPDKGYNGGAITAALFLREFVGATPWAHLDIAGPARAEGDSGEITKGATGFGVRTLLRWLSR